MKHIKVKINFVLLGLLFSIGTNAQKVLRPAYKEAFHEIKTHTIPWEDRESIAYAECDWGLWEIMIGDSLNIENQDETIIFHHSPNENTNNYTGIEYRICDPDIMEGNITFSGKVWVGENDVLALSIKQDNAKALKNFFHNGDEWQSFQLSIPYKNCTFYKRSSVLIDILHLSNSPMSKLKDLKITCDGTDLDSLCPLPKANTDTTFKSSSHFNLQEPLTNEQVKRLETICKVWGFLKYHHPCVMRGDFDWNYEFFRILPLIYMEGNYRRFCRELEKHIPSQTITDHIYLESTDSVIGKISKSWINGLPQSIQKKLIKIEKGPRYQQNYALSYGWREVDRKIIKFSNERSYHNIDYTDDGYRLLCLFRYWNMMYYFHPYMYLKENEWLNCLSKHIRTFAAAEDEYSFEESIVTLVCSLKDSHSDIYNLKSNILGIGGGPWDEMYLPMVTRLRNNYLVVSSFLNDKMFVSGIKKGDLISKINGKNVSDIYKEKNIYSPFYNPNSDTYSLAYQSFDGDSVSFEIIRGKETITLSIDSVYSKCWTGNMIDINANIISHKDCGDSIYYINLSTLSSSELKYILEEVSKYKQIVFDCRGYRFEPELMNVLADFLYEKPHSPFFCSYIDILEPGVVKKNPIIPTYGKENPNYYKGNVYALVDGETMSFSEWLANLIKGAPKGKICGSRTTGVLGGAAPVPLTSGIHTCFTGYGVYHNDGRCSYYDGCPIDIQIGPTLLDEDALNVLLDKIRPKRNIQE